jgi:hypothetical protein
VSEQDPVVRAGVKTLCWSWTLFPVPVTGTESLCRLRILVSKPDPNPLSYLFSDRNLKMFQYCLKVPKREIFDRSDFPDFYTIKSSWVGDLLVKILTYYFNF